MRIRGSMDGSRLRQEVFGVLGWLAGAAVSLAWMLQGSGVVRPLALFAVWATAVCFLSIRSLDMASKSIPSLKKALRYGGYSTCLLALATLFLEHWPVTVSMAILFAVCCTFKSDDLPAYN